MSAATAKNMDTQRPVIMFVDDEQRVLKSMRAMFRREFDVHLANSGAEALEILAEHSIDVVVSDQRMPYMTGVEVLSEIKARSPDTVRILLTGYADLAAVEASINEAEVFRYLMKPCPADEVRGAVQAGLEMRAADVPIAEVLTVAEPHLAEESVKEANEGEVVQLKKSNVTALPVKPKRKTAVAEGVVDRRTQAVQVLVLSQDKSLYSGIREACPDHQIHPAADLEQAVELAGKYPVGVVVTDLGVDEKAVATLGRALRKVTPEIVIILASERSDANLLIQLINSGQVFRFLLKPLQIGQCKIWLTSALRRFVESGGEALAVLDNVVHEPSAWVRFKNWFLGVQG